MAELDDVAALKTACDKAYDANPTSCSNAVWDVVKAVENQNEPFRSANDLIDHMEAQWKRVTMDDGYTLANKGTVVVGGKKQTGHGHVVVIYPGQKKPAGGYNYWYKPQKKYLYLNPKGSYPLAMSTSIGARSSLDWPGALSRGDKTVWDPWGKDDAFADVLFWTPKTK
jgi:hypothetical protein